MIIIADKFSKEQRHFIMSQIKGNDTSIEIKVRKWLYHKGIRYRKNYKKLKGSPDIAITKNKIAIFINGCFWHGHENCKYFKLPKTRTEFWKNKIETNISRDLRIKNELESEGWQVMTVWECQLKKDFEIIMNNLLNSINDVKTVQCVKKDNLNSMNKENDVPIEKESSYENLSTGSMEQQTIAAETFKDYKS